MGNPMLLSDAVDLYDERIQKVYLKAEKEMTKYYKSFVFEQNTDLFDYRESGFTDMGVAAEIDENGAVGYNNPDQGFDKTFTQREFGSGFHVGRKLWKFGKHNIIKQMPQRLVYVLNRRVEQDAADFVINKGWDSSYTTADGKVISLTGGNGAALFSSSQSREDAGTANNNIVYNGTTYNMDFAEDALRAAYQTADAIKTGSGNQDDINLNRFVFKKDSDLHFKALQFQKGDKEVDSDANNLNVFKGRFELAVTPYISAANKAYYVALDSRRLEESGVKIVWSEKPNLFPVEIVYDTQSLKYQARMMYDIGHVDYRAYVGSKGNNT